jgi:hypothetical protein
MHAAALRSGDARFIQRIVRFTRILAVSHSMAASTGKQRRQRGSAQPPHRLAAGDPQFPDCVASGFNERSTAAKNIHAAALVRIRTRCRTPETRVWRFQFVQQAVAQVAQTAIEFPPMSPWPARWQPGASFNLEAVKGQIEKARAAHGQ